MDNINQQPKVSIIVPIYNGEASIERCVRAILDQKFSDFELILIDDGSTDRTEEVCEKLSKEDCRIKYIRKRNEGVSATRNLGLSVAKGEYIQFCDSDDYPLQGWTMNLLDLITKEGTDLAICKFRRNDGMQSIQKNIKVTFYERTDAWNLFRRILLTSPWNKMYKRAIIIENGLFFDQSKSNGEDLSFNLGYLTYCKGKIAVTSEELYYYDYNDNGLTGSYIRDFWNIKRKSMEELKVKMETFMDFSKIKRDYYSYYLDGALQCVYNNLKKDSKLSFGKRREEINKILQSSEFDMALKECDITSINKLFYVILKKKSFFVLYLWIVLMKIKKKVFNKR